MDANFEEKITGIMNTMEAAGYDSKIQLSEYIRTGDQRYITRKNNARRMITELDWVQLRKYVSKLNL